MKVCSLGRETTQRRPPGDRLGQAMKLVILVLEIRGPKLKVDVILPGKVLLGIPFPVDFVLHSSGASVATVAENSEYVPLIKTRRMGPTSIERSLIVVKKAGGCLLDSTLGHADAQTSGETELKTEGVVGLRLKTEDADGLECSCERVSENSERKEGCVLLTGHHVSLVGL